jgi:hypothetical protein
LAHGEVVSVAGEAIDGHRRPFDVVLDALNDDASEPDDLSVSDNTAGGDGRTAAFDPTGE